MIAAMLTFGYVVLGVVMFGAYAEASPARWSVRKFWVFAVLWPIGLVAVGIARARDSRGWRA